MHSICQHECKQYAHNRNTANAFLATMEQPSRTVVHAKLEMTNPDSQEEVEADAVANEIVQGGKIARSILSGSADGGMAVSSQMEGRLNSLQGCGQVMPDGLRNMMERGFNRDFSQVCLHTDSEAASLSSSIHAKAFTHGNDIYFNQGQFAPNTSEGQKLMAHELTHVVQGGGKVGRKLYDSYPYVSEVPTTLGNATDTRTWLTANVLDEEAREILFEDRQSIEQRTPINIVLYTTRSAACNGKDYIAEPNCSKPFEGQDLNNFIKNTRNNTNLRTFVLYGNNKILDYSTEMKGLVDKYGPLQNLVIYGHGNWFGPNIGTYDKFYFFYHSDIKNVMTFFNEVKDLMFNSQDANKETMHSVVFDECLVGVGLGDHNYADKVYEIVSEGGKFPVRVFANYAAKYPSENENTGITNAEISYDTDKNLTYKNHTDPTAVCVSDASERCSSKNVKYKGDELGGYLAEVWRQCNKTENHIENIDLFSSNSPWIPKFSNWKGKEYKLQRSNTDVSETMFVQFVNEKIDIINSPNRSEKTRTRTRRQLKEFVNYMYFRFTFTSLDPNNVRSLQSVDIDEEFRSSSTNTHRHLGDRSLFK